MRSVLSLLSGLFSAMFGCGQHRPAADQPLEKDLAVAVPKDDASIWEAARQARDTLDRFTERLAAPGPGQSGFSIKVPVHDGETMHHLWLQNVAVDGPGFCGTLGSDAAGLGVHHPGERIGVGRQEVEDWMYVEEGKLAGGFSLRAIRERLSGKAREAFERSMWFKFE